MAAQSLYSGLDQNAKEIRLATVSPQPGSPVQVNLRTVSLDQEPLYDALSYCWGDRSTTKPIVLDGNRVQVTENLEAALSQFRDDANGKEVVLWIDAICINQQDPAERAHQVSIMGKVFSQAHQVRAWLGIMPRSAADAFSRFIWQAAERDMISLTPSSMTLPSPLEDLREILHPGETLVDFGLALHMVYQSSYWTRKWIIQEAVLGRRMRIYLGAHHVEMPLVKSHRMVPNWPAISSFAYFLVTSHPMVTVVASEPRTEGYDVTSALKSALVYSALGSTLHAITMATIQLLTNNTRTQKSPLVDNMRDKGDMVLITQSRSANASDAHDCVFAIQGLLDDKLTIAPDYSSEVAEVFSKFTVHVARTHQSLEILEQAAPGVTHLPSWVPDFTLRAPPQIAASKRWSAAGESGGRIARIDDQTITVPGVLIDKVACVVSTLDHDNLYPNGSSWQDHARFVWSAWESAHYSYGQTSSSLLVNRHFRNLYEAITGPNRLARNSFASFCIILGSALLGQSEMHGGEEHALEFFRCFTNAATRCVLFITTSGRIGAASLGADCGISPGDEIMLLASATRPFLVRQAPKGSLRAWKLLCACYVSGQC